MKPVSDNATAFSTVALECFRQVVWYGLGIAAVIAACAALYYGLPVVYKFLALSVVWFVRFVSVNHTTVWPAYGASLALIALSAWCGCVRNKLKGQWRIVVWMHAISISSTVLNILCLCAVGIVIGDTKPDSWTLLPLILFAAGVIVAAVSMGETVKE